MKNSLPPSSLSPSTARGEKIVPMGSFASNPFSTRFVSPGQLAWIGDENYLEQLVLRWRLLKCRAAIVGAHGSGKSTLLEHFVPLIGNVIWRRNAEGQEFVSDFSDKGLGNDSSMERPPTLWLQLRRTAPPSMMIPWKELQPGRLLVLDGYEQLVRWQRAVLLVRTKLRGVRLLVASHRRTILGTLCKLSISSNTALHIVSQLTAGRDDIAKSSEDEIERRLKAHGGNMRDVLMELYDQYEDQGKNEAGKVKSNP